MSDDVGEHGVTCRGPETSLAVHIAKRCIATGQVLSLLILGSDPRM